MSSRDWCTLDQWLTCQRPLCPVVVRHDQLPAPDQVADHALQVCFASARLGGHVLQDGGTQVNDELPLHFSTIHNFFKKSSRMGQFHEKIRYKINE